MHCDRWRYLSSASVANRAIPSTCTPSEVELATVGVCRCRTFQSASLQTAVQRKSPKHRVHRMPAKHRSTRVLDSRGCNRFGSTPESSHVRRGRVDGSVGSAHLNKDTYRWAVQDCYAVDSGLVFRQNAATPLVDQPESRRAKRLMSTQYSFSVQ